MQVRNEGFDHVEFYVKDIKPHADLYTKWGFEKVGERKRSSNGTITHVYSQGWIRLLLTAPDGSAASEKSNVQQFLNTHGEGISCLALEVDNAADVYKTAVKNGARSAMEPQSYESNQGRVTRSEIWTLGDFRYVLMERDHDSDFKKPALLDDDLVVSRLESPMPCHFRRIDHLTNNVGLNEMKDWVDWYKKVFNFKVTRHFDINTGRTGLTSDVVESQDRKIKVPINEPTEKESQVYEFVQRFNGTGVQHLALETTEITKTIPTLTGHGYKFLGVPHTYYEAVPGRLSKYSEDLELLEDLQVLIDGDDQGYLLQTFTEELIGPFFYEVIQRKGNEGFGEGNFQALFEAIERDQIRRGVLKPA